MVTYSCCPQDKYPNLDYSLKLQRKSKFYSQNLLVPCVLISMLAPFTFLLPGNKLNIFYYTLIIASSVSWLGGEDIAWCHHFIVTDSLPADCCRADAAIWGNVFLFLWDQSQNERIYLLLGSFISTQWRLFRHQYWLQLQYCQSGVPSVWLITSLSILSRRRVTVIGFRSWQPNRKVPPLWTIGSSTGPWVAQPNYQIFNGSNYLQKTNYSSRKHGLWAW